MTFARSVLPALAVCLLALPVAAQTKFQLVHYGRLMNALDEPVSAAVDLKFRLLDRSSKEASETQLWSATCRVQVSGGAYSVVLGSDCGEPLDSALFPPGAGRFLELVIGATALSPRLAIGVVPSAARAGDADRLGGKDATQFWSRGDAVDASKLEGKSVSDLDARWVKRNAQGDIEAAGNTRFVGNGLGLTSLDATQLRGVVPVGVLPSEVALRNTVNIFSADVRVASGAKFIGDGSGLTNIDITQLSGGTLILPAAPTTPTQAANKQYVDDVSLSRSLGSALNPALSCDAIKAVAPNAATTTYWLKPSGATAAYPQLCVMENVGKTIPVRRSCAELYAANPSLPSGLYEIEPRLSNDTDNPGRAGRVWAYCQMRSDGGWTLVWSNTRGGSGKLTTGMPWNVAVNGAPRYRGNLGVDLEKFEAYVGLRFWTGLAPESKIRYDWSKDYGVAVSRSNTASFVFDTVNNYKITFSNVTVGVGSGQNSFFSAHNGAMFSTYDRDNDGIAGTNCSADRYTGAPWWYGANTGACWLGSINGGGEADSDSYYNGAYWIGSDRRWGDDAATGAGNGWIFVK